MWRVSPGKSAWLSFSEGVSDQVYRHLQEGATPHSDSLPNLVQPRGTKGEKAAGKRK